MWRPPGADRHPQGAHAQGKHLALVQDGFEVNGGCSLEMNEYKNAFFGQAVVNLDQTRTFEKDQEL